MQYKWVVKVYFFKFKPIIMRERINVDYIIAFKAKDDLGKSTLSLLKNAIQSEEKIKGELTDDEVIGIIQKQVKQSYSINIVRYMTRNNRCSEYAIDT